MITLFGSGLKLKHFKLVSVPLIYNAILHFCPEPNKDDEFYEIINGKRWGGAGWWWLDSTRMGL